MLRILASDGEERVSERWAASDSSILSWSVLSGGIKDRPVRVRLNFGGTTLCSNSLMRDGRHPPFFRGHSLWWMGPRSRAQICDTRAGGRDTFVGEGTARFHRFHSLDLRLQRILDDTRIEGFGRLTAALCSAARPDERCFLRFATSAESFWFLNALRCFILLVRSSSCVCSGASGAT